MTALTSSRAGVAILLALCASSLRAQALPVTPAESLSGRKLEFPTALAGKPAVCIFGFSKEAGDHSKAWLSKLDGENINAWSMANLEGAPSLVRGMIKGAMRNGTTPALQERSLLMTKDMKAWKAAVGGKKDSLPLVVLFDAKGQVAWTWEGLLADEPYQQLKTRLAALPSK